MEGLAHADVSALSKLFPPEVLLVVDRVLHERVDVHLAPLDRRERRRMDIQTRAYFASVRSDAACSGTFLCWASANAATASLNITSRSGATGRSSIGSSG